MCDFGCVCSCDILLLICVTSVFLVRVTSVLLLFRDFLISYVIGSCGFSTFGLCDLRSFGYYDSVTMYLFGSCDFSTFDLCDFSTFGPCDFECVWFM